MINNNNSGIYFPINYTEVSSVVPKEDDIIYSTKAKGLHESGNTIYKWESHLLITTGGIAYTRPYKKQNESYFIPWEQVDMLNSITKTKKKIIPSKHRGFSLSIVRDKKYETKEKFAERIQNFMADVRPYAIKKKREWIETNQENPDVKKKQVK